MGVCSSSSCPNSTISFTSLLTLSIFGKWTQPQAYGLTGCLVWAWKQLGRPYLRAHYNLLQPCPRLGGSGIACPEMPEHERLPRLGKFPLICTIIGMLQTNSETKDILRNYITTHIDRPQLAINIIDMAIGSCLPSTASWSVTLYDSTRPVSLRKLSSGLTPGYSILYVQQIRQLTLDKGPSKREVKVVWTCLILAPLKTVDTNLMSSS